MPMQREPLASDGNRNALPADTGGEENYLQIQSNRFQASDAHVVQEESRRSQRSRSTAQENRLCYELNTLRKTLSLI